MPGTTPIPTCEGCLLGWPRHLDTWRWPYTLIHTSPAEQFVWCRCGEGERVMAIVTRMEGR